jgi:hypothetical protein
MEELIIRLRSAPLSSALLRNESTRRAWEIVIALDEAKLERFTGIRDVLNTAAPLIDPKWREPGISSYSFRRGLRELVDHGYVTCEPNPARGDRLPD